MMSWEAYPSQNKSTQSKDGKATFRMSVDREVLLILSSLFLISDAKAEIVKERKLT